MKKLLLVFALILFSVTGNAQKSWSLELGVGNHSIVDEYLDLSDNYIHFNGTVRYSFNEKFGVGLYGGYDKLNLVNYMTLEEYNVNYFRVDAEGVVDMFEVLDLSNNVFTLLAHGGAGASFTPSQTFPNISGGFTGLFKVTKNAAIKLDWTTTGHFNLDSSYDGEGELTNVGIQSLMNNASVGIAFYFGKSKGKSKEHYDWHVEPKKDLLAPVRPIIREYHNTKIVQIPAENFAEHVFFKYDVDEFNDGTQAFNAIRKTYERSLLEGKVVNVVGYASPENSTGISKYNMDLARRRANTVVRYLISLGVKEENILVTVEGGEDTYDSLNIELNRRVSLYLK